jgi:hypothetical protein
MVSNPKEASLAQQAGFHSTSRYNINTANKVMPDFTERYEDVMEAHHEHWNKMTNESPLINLPVVTMGWDPTPRCRQDFPWPYPYKEYPYVPVVVGNTPKLYEQLLNDAAKHIEKMFVIHLQSYYTVGMNGQKVVIYFLKNELALLLGSYKKSIWRNT